MAATAYIFNASLVGFRGVTRRIAVRDDQRLTDLHDGLQEAFEWNDDHLYAFRLGGEFWGHADMYSRPFELDPDEGSAEERIDGLGLEVGQKVAYVFDFGDEWRVMLTVAAIEPADDGAYPRIVASRGEAPPQYGDEEAWEEVA